MFAVAISGAAEREPAGAPMLKQARAAWDRGSHEAAEPLYRDALEKGGLAPSEVLEGYIRLGAIRASLGKKDSALAAFRAASVLDSNFTVPSEAGTKGRKIAEKAKKDTAKIGTIQFTAQVPRDVAAGKSFKVSATIDRSHLRMLKRIALLAKDIREGATTKDVVLEATPDESVEFEVPADLTTPGATISVRVDALDAHDNRLASSEERVRVSDSQPAAVAVAPSAASAKPSTARPESGGANPMMETPPPVGDHGVRTGGSFWSSPWPYIIGGIALAGTGAAVYFGTRPSDNVTVGSAGVRPQ